MDDNDVILDFDNNVLIVTTIRTLEDISNSENPFERFLLQPFFKITKNISLEDFTLRIKYSSWRHRNLDTQILPLTRKERALLAHIINSSSQDDIFSSGELDSKTLSTHKYNMLRKMNLPSIAYLTQIHHRWESFRQQATNIYSQPESLLAFPARETGLWPHQPLHQFNTL